MSDNSDVAGLVRPSSAAINQAQADAAQALTDWGCAYVSGVGMVASRLLSASVWHGLHLLKAGKPVAHAQAEARRLLGEGFECMRLMGYALWDCDAELRQALRHAFADAMAPTYHGEVHPTDPVYLPGLRAVYTVLAADLDAMPTKPAVAD